MEESHAVFLHELPHIITRRVQSWVMLCKHSRKEEEKDQTEGSLQ